MTLNYLIALVFSTSLVVDAGQTASRNLLFDFGPPSSRASKGYLVVTPATRFSAKVGYGWTASPQRAFQTTPTRMHDETTLDGVLSSSSIEFQVAAPPGEYFLTATLGGGDQYYRGMDVHVNGERFCETITTPWYRLPFRSVRKRITVRDAPLRVLVSPSPGSIQLSYESRLREHQSSAAPESIHVSLHSIELRSVTPHIPIRFSTELESDTADVARAARELELRMRTSPDDVAATNQLVNLRKYLQACYYYDIGWWSWAIKESGINFFNRLWFASNFLREIIAEEDDPLYFKAMYLLGKIHYWLYEEQHEQYNQLEAEKFFAAVARRYPDNRLVQMYRGEKVPHKSLPGDDDGDAPLWAVNQRNAITRLVEFIHWWVDNRQIENGEMGGGYGDDVELTRWWWPAVFGADDKKTKHGISRLAEGVWNSGLLKRGYLKEVQDVEHSAEYFTDTHPVMLLLAYGDPRYVERCLTSMQNFRDVWSGIDQKGHRHFRSCYLSADSVVNEPPFSVDVPMNARATLPGLWVLWYNQNPMLLKLFSEWGNAWVEDALRTDKGKPKGILPAAVSFEGDEIGGYSDNWHDPNLGWHYYRWEHLGGVSEMYNQLLGISVLTGDERYLMPMKHTVSLAMGGSQVAANSDSTTGSLEWTKRVLNGEWRPEVVSRAKVLLQSNEFDDFLLKYGDPYARYLTSGDKGVLERGCARMFDALSYNFELRTSEVKFTDRVPVAGVETLLSMYTGGVGKEFPSMAVTWENTGTDVAAFAARCDRTSLKVLLYNFKAEKKVAVRLWRLDEGKYEVRVGIDRNNDDVIDSLIKTEVFELRERGQRYEIPLQHGEVHVLEFKQTEKSQSQPSPRPDIALSNAELTVSSLAPKPGELVQVGIPVHNVGNLDASDVQVQFHVDGREIGSQQIDRIEAPNDLTPRSKLVKAQWRAEPGTHRLKATVYVEAKEITVSNNSAERVINVR